MLSDSKLVKKGQRLTDFTITNYNNRHNSIKKLIKNKSTFLFFWNPVYVSPEYISSRINYLTQQFPQVQFIQIQINDNFNKIIPELDIKNQYFITPKSDANQFLTSKMPRGIILNNKGMITNGFASISSKNLQKELERLK